MYLSINVLLIILTLQCLTVRAAYKGINHCTIPIPKESNKMPIPIYVSRLSGDIRTIYPDQFGNIMVRDRTNLKLTCTGATFITPFFYNGDVVVKCVNGNLTNRGKMHNFNSYKCRTNPKPRMMVTQHTCHKIINKIIEVGFETYYGFKKMYKICYNTLSKNPLYAWYFVRTPLNAFRQTSLNVMSFMSSNGKVNLNVVDSYSNQTNTLQKILGSKELAEKYINNDTRHYLTPGHLLSPNEFIYSSEQHATYYYENTVPQWLSFKEDIWNEVEKLFFQNVNSTYANTHLVVTGAYLPTMFPDSSSRQQAMYLSEPRVMPIPQYIWKMDYNIETDAGTVYIAMSNPYLTTNETGYICNTIPCPNFEKLGDEAKKVVYCCSKKSFETAYRQLDPTVYERF